MAVPVTDDDGVDVIVDYRTLVQVKSSAASNVAGVSVSLTSRGASERGDTQRGLATHADVLLVYARDIAAWWIIPADRVPRTNVLTLNAKWDEWRNAWEVFDSVASP